MTGRTRLVIYGTLVEVVVASVFLLERRERGAETIDPLALHLDGIGPLRLGLDLERAAAAAQRVAPDSAMVGPGCGDRDEVTYSGVLGNLPVTVMAMADDGIVTEVELTLDGLSQAENEAACVVHRARLAAPFVERFGPEGESWVVRKPVSSEHRVQIGPAVVVARWFSAGRSCYISANYGGVER
jgi:hypothetical protein